MRRRTFLSTIGVGLLAAPLAAEAQQAGRMYRIGYLLEGRPPDQLWALEETLRDLGYVEGTNLVVLVKSGTFPDERNGLGMGTGALARTRCVRCRRWLSELGSVFVSDGRMRRQAEGSGPEKEVFITLSLLTVTKVRSGLPEPGVRSRLPDRS